MAYYKDHLHQFILISGIALGLLVTGGYSATASSGNFNSSSNDFNTAHTIVTFNRASSRQVNDLKDHQKTSGQTPQNEKHLLPNRTIIKYHRILNGMNHYYNRAKVAKPKEITSSHRYVKRNLPSLGSGRDGKQADSQSSSRNYDENHRQPSYQTASDQNSHLIISFSTPNRQNYPMKAETANDRTNHVDNSESQKSAQLNNDASNVDNQVGDWFRDGLNDSELNARNWISWRESNDRWDVLSYGGRCIGYFQLSPRYLGYINGHLNLDHQHQVRVADHYARSKYGSWSAAKQFWLNHRWY